MMLSVAIGHPIATVFYVDQKEKNMKRFMLTCALLMTMLAAAACLALGTSAVEASTAEEFIDAVTEGGTVTLTADITLAEGISVAGDVRIEGEGHTITFSAIYRFTQTSEYITVSGSSKVAGYGLQIVGGNVTLSNVTLKNAGTTMAKGGAMLLLSGNAALVLDNVVTDGSHFPLVYDAAATVTVKGSNAHIGANAGQFYAIAATANADGATLCLQGGTVSHTVAGVLRGNGHCVLLKCAAFTLRVEGGSIAAAEHAVYMPQGALTLQMTGGTVSSVSGRAVQMDSGSALVRISGGSISAKQGAVLALPEHTANDVEISGGSILAGTADSYVWKATGKTLITGNAVLEGSLLIAGGTVTVSGNARLTSPTYTDAAAARPALVQQLGASTLLITGGKLDIGDANATVLFLKDAAAEATVSGGRLVVGSAGSIAKLAAGALQIRGGLIVDGCAVTGTVFADGVTLTDCAVITKYPKSVGGSTAADLTENSSRVKYTGELYYLWVGFAADESAPTLEEGAGVRAQLGSQGIRFTATVDAKAVAALEERGEVTYGILIAPADYVAAAGDFTLTALEAYASAGGREASAVYVNVVAEKSLRRTEAGVSFNAVLIDVQSYNYDRAFAAVAYASVNGCYYYSAFDSAANARSLSDVAVTALADVRTASELEADEALRELYIHRIAETDQYSKYTEEQRKALAGYVTA